MSKKGAHVENVIDKMQAQASAGVLTHEDPRAGGPAGFNNLPRKFKSADSGWDNAVEMKRQLMEDNNGTPDTPYGQVQFTDRDARALLEKKKAGEAALFDGWFGKNFNTADLPTRLLGEQLNPEYYQEREEALVQKAQLALRIELMKLYGPRSEEDLMIIFGLQTGYLRLDDQWNRVGFDGSGDNAYDQPNNKARFQRDINAVSRFFQGYGTGAGNTRGTQGWQNVGMQNASQSPFGNGTTPDLRPAAPGMFGGNIGGVGLSSFFDFLRGE